MELDMKQIGNRIATRRKKMNMKQNVLAEKLDISNNHMSGIENGKEKPSIPLLAKICDILNVTPDFILLGNMRASNISRDLSNLLQLCSDEEIELVVQIVQYFIYLRSLSTDSDK